MEDERGNIEWQWSLSDKDKGAITSKENIEHAKQSSYHKTYNVSNEPLFLTLPLTNVMDNLHLFWHTSDVLIDLLIVELCWQDVIEKAKTPVWTELGCAQGSVISMSWLVVSVLILPTTVVGVQVYRLLHGVQRNDVA